MPLSQGSQKKPLNQVSEMPPLQQTLSQAQGAVGKKKKKETLTTLFSEQLCIKKNKPEHTNSMCP